VIIIIIIKIIIFIIQIIIFRNPRTLGLGVDPRELGHVNDPFVLDPDVKTY